MTASTSPHWAIKYIGIPWKDGTQTMESVSCWGLVHLIYEKELGRQLPDYPLQACCGKEMYIKDTIRIIKKEKDSGKWRRVEKPSEYSIVALSRNSIFHHVGVWTEKDGGKIIHSQDGIGVRAQTLLDLKREGWASIYFFEYDFSRSTEKPV